jgi:hypothetical protein
VAKEDDAVELGIESHLGLPLYRKFKSCGNANSYLLCMIAAETASGLKPLLWTKRLLATLDRIGLKSDWLFQEADHGRS